jgi:hypothetical protein
VASGGIVLLGARRKEYLPPGRARLKIPKKGRTTMLLLIIILLLVFGGGGGYYGHTRWGPGGGVGIGLGTILVILLIAYMLGMFR